MGIMKRAKKNNGINGTTSPSPLIGPRIKI